MNRIFTNIFITSSGELIPGSFNDRLCLCDWRYREMRRVIDGRIRQGLDADYEDGTTEVIKETIKQLKEYFARERKGFTVPLAVDGTDFQKKVWYEIAKVKYGSTESCLGLAGNINKKPVRTVAAANGANAISVFIPCSRIIGSDGELTGYAGGLNVKKNLLQLEADTGQMELFDQ